MVINHLLTGDDPPSSLPHTYSLSVFGSLDDGVVLAFSNIPQNWWRGILVEVGDLFFGCYHGNT